MPVEDRAQHRRASIFGGRHEEPQAPGDDLRGEAERLELRHGSVGEAGELDAIRAHDEGAAELQTAGEIEHRAALADGAPTLLPRQVRPARTAHPVIDAGASLAG